jgi:hypothetical protein
MTAPPHPRLAPGLFVAGLGPGLLVVPLVNVVLVAVPADLAGAAAGLFSTAQHHGFTSAFAHATPLAVVGYLLCGVCCLLLPRTAVAEDPSVMADSEAVLVAG